MVVDADLFRLIRSLLLEMATTDVVELVYETAETKLLIRKQVCIEARTEATANVATRTPPARPPSPPADAGAPAGKSSHLLSPLTGVFYRTSKPDGPPYAVEGDSVEAGRIVGLIEAMKVFNEIRVEEPCRIRAFLATTGQLVQKDQPLLVLEKE